MKVIPMPPEVEKLLEKIEDRYPRAAMKVRSAWECPELADVVFDDFFCYEGTERQGFAPDAFMTLHEIHSIFVATYPKVETAKEAHRDIWRGG